MPIASIIILTYDNLDLTRQCLESIFEKTGRPDFEVIIVDNASTDDTPEYLQLLAAGQSNVRLVLNTENTGFACGNNQGAALAEGDYIVFLNNDTVVTRGWLEGLIGYLQDPVVGMVGPVTNSSGNESRIRVDYRGLEGMEEFAERYTQAHAGEGFEIDMLAFMCVALRRLVWEEIGPLDERFRRGMFEDDDYALRLKQAGYKILCAEDVFIHHWGSASFMKLGQTTYRQLFEENRRKFEEKWGRSWQPYLYRRELLGEQMREMVDAAAWREAEIASRDQAITNLQTEVGWRDEIIIGQNKELTVLQTKLGDLGWKLQVAERSLKEIHESTSWRVMERIRHLLIPPGTRWEQAVHSLSHRLQGLNTVPMISWEAYAFYRFKRSRRAVYKPHLEGVRCPSIAGLVSIVLPVYNGADYVSEAIESILSQTYTEFELIAVDDGSTDETPGILDGYAGRDGRIRVIHQANARLPGALNTGFHAARGEYMIWTSADNRLKPDYLVKMVDCLKRHPEWEWVYANIDMIGEDGQPLSNSSWYSGYQDPPGSGHISLPADPLELNVVANNYVGAAFMYRDRADILLGDYSRFRFGTEDYDYCMRANALLTLRHTDFSERHYEYRFHGTSLTSRDVELGITRSREGLMVFEDARRDFYNTPLGWLITESGDQQAKALAGRMRDWAKAAGHVLLDEITLDLRATPRLWFPLVAVRVTADAAEAAQPPMGPERAYPVLIVTGGGSLPETADSGWDMCIAAAPVVPLVRLQQPRQGWLGIADVPELCTAVDIRTKSQHLGELEAEIAKHAKPSLKISVVISTYRRGAQLGDAIRSVAKQSFPAEDYEIIVVNNDPCDTSVVEIVAGLRQTDFAGTPGQLRLVVCPFKGLSFARNAGISEACGQVISFLDDDAIAFPDWLEQVWRAFEAHPKAGVVGGTILLKPPEPHPKWLKPGWEYYWSGFIPPYEEAKPVEQWGEFPYGANWSASRIALLQVGGFRTGYGRRGADYGGGEETIAACLIQRLGYQIVVAPSAKIQHLPDPRRYTLAHLWKTIRANWFSEYQQQIDLYSPEQPDLRALRQRRWEQIRKVLFSWNLPAYRRLEHLLYTTTISQVMRRLRQDLHARERLLGDR